MAHAIATVFERAVDALRLDSYCAICGGPRSAGAGVLVVPVSIEPLRCSACQLELAPDGGCAWELGEDGGIALSVVITHGVLPMKPPVPV